MDDGIKDVIKDIVVSSKKELLSKTDTELQDYWYFKYDPGLSKQWNIHKFCQAITLFTSFCEDWEEDKNGHCCLVERVRDKYLYPKMDEFIQDFEKHIQEGK